jgi:hypothetical protein
MHTAEGSSEERRPAMLSEAEQRKLSEIESQLRAEDPSFVLRFGDRGLSWLRRRWCGVLALLAVAAAVVVAGIGLVMGSVGTVVIAITAIGASAGMWVTHRRP